MILCLVTDRRRLAGAMGQSSARAVELLIEQIEGAIAGGVDLIQVREGDLDSRDLLALVRRIISQVSSAQPRLIVNDRLDVALAAGAAGVHLKESSFSVDAATRIAPSSLVIGRSVHAPEATLGTQPVSYFVAGTVRPTKSKPAGPFLGFDGLAAVVSAAGERPVLAIGGLSLSDAPAVAATGARGMAAVGAFVPDGNLDLGPFVQIQAEKLRLAFDSARTVT